MNAPSQKESSLQVEYSPDKPVSIKIEGGRLAVKPLGQPEDSSPCSDSRYEGLELGPDYFEVFSHGPHTYIKPVKKTEQATLDQMENWKRRIDVKTKTVFDRSNLGVYEICILR